MGPAIQQLSKERSLYSPDYIHYYQRYVISVPKIN